MAKKRDSRYEPGKRTRDWLKVKTHLRAGVRRRRLHEGQGPARGRVRRAHPRGRRGAASSTTSATSARASRKTRSSGCWQLRPLERNDPPFAEVPKMPKVRQDDVVWVEPKLVGRGRVRRVDARRPPARAGVQGLARGQGAGRGAPRDRSLHEIRRGKRVLRLSNLDKVFWPEEGITKGDLIAYYRDVARRRSSRT